jgi:hypothetical protein
MILAQPDGPTIELSIVGYEFPDGGTGWHDWNWLNVEVHVRSGPAAWSGGPDACLLTTEARELAAWLRAVASGAEREPGVDFLEPELAFAVVRRLASGEVEVRITLGYLLIREQNLVPGEKLEELPIVVRVSPASLHTAAADLEASLRHWPERRDPEERGN